MASSVHKGEIAKKNYQQVHFYPFKNEPACSFILTANPFSYLKAWLDGEIESYGRKRSTAKRLEKAKYFCELSESFNQSAKSSILPVKGTLLYYSYLNLVKCFLLVDGIDLEDDTEHHGLTMPPTFKKKIKISPKPAGSVSIFWEFSKRLGDDVIANSGYEITLEELLDEMPEVHEIGHALGILKTKRKFLPVKIDIMTNSGTYTKLFYEFNYKSHQKHIIPVGKLERNHFRSKVFKVDCYQDDVLDRIFYRSNLKPSFTKESDTSWKGAYHKLTNELDEIGATVMLTNDGYRYYMNLAPGRLHRLSASFALMFYLGSVARYRPTLYDKVLKGKYQPIINEVIDTCPRQFYYLMVSRITKQVCAIPMAKI
jgi:hypothetical protein